VISFYGFFLAYLFLIISFYYDWDWQKNGITKNEVLDKFHIVTVSLGVTMLLLAVSSAPIFFILNKLINRSIEDSKNE